MHTTAPHRFLQHFNNVQRELLPFVTQEVGSLTPKLEKVIHALEWARVEDVAMKAWCGTGRPMHERTWLANAYVAKAVLNIGTTADLIDRLKVDRSLRRICGFPLYRQVPSEATFSRAFTEFAVSRLAEHAHEKLIEETLGDVLIGHVSRDGTAILVREKPRPQPETVEETAPQKPKKRGRPRKDEARPQAKESPIERQRKQTLAQMLKEIPTGCDRGTKCNAQGYKVSWNGYKLHIDTTDCGVPVSALLSSASMHDSRAAVPLSRITQKRVTNLYDLMDAAYCSSELQEHCRSLGHVPLIDHNPRGGQKDEFEPADAIRYRERTVAKRTNARLKDEFGARSIMVRGHVKVMSHLMFGVLALSVDQLIRLRARE